MRAEQLLPGASAPIVGDGVAVRPATVGSCCANAFPRRGPAPGAAERDAEPAGIAASLQALRALRCFDVFEVRARRLRAVAEARP